jgi:hypothetical protein
MQELSSPITNRCESVHSAGSLPTQGSLLSSLSNCFGADEVAWRAVISPAAPSPDSSARPLRRACRSPRSRRQARSRSNRSLKRAGSRCVGFCHCRRERIAPGSIAPITDESRPLHFRSFRVRYRGDIEQLRPALGALRCHRVGFGLGLGFAHESSSAYHCSKSNSESLNFLERIRPGPAVPSGYAPPSGGTGLPDRRKVRLGRSDVAAPARPTNKSLYGR